MIDFKPIEEFTFDDCVKSIERQKSEGSPIDADLHARYEQLLSSLKSQEKRDFLRCNTIESIEKYLKKYTSLNGANRYRAQYIQQAKEKIIQLKRIRRRKQLFKRFSIIAGILAVIVLITFIGYRPVSYLSVSASSMKFSKESGHSSVKIRTDAPYHNLYDSDSYLWLSTSTNGDSIEITVTRNDGDTRNGTIVITAYPTFFGESIDFLKKQCQITVKQEDGYATYLNVSRDNISFYPEGDTESVYVSTDGIECDIDDPSKDWLSVYKDGSYIKIRAYENTDQYSRSGSIRLYSDNIEKYISVSQSAYEKDAGITDVSWPACGGNEDIPIKVDYYIQGYKDDDLYVVMKIYSDNNNYVWFKKYDDIYESQRKLESYRTFRISSSARSGRTGNNTVYVCISRYTDGSNPICSFEQRLTLQSSH